MSPCLFYLLLTISCLSLTSASSNNCQGCVQLDSYSFEKVIFIFTSLPFCAVYWLMSWVNEDILIFTNFPYYLSQKLISVCQSIISNESDFIFNLGCIKIQSCHCES